jgi:hypothetical protein
MITSAPRASPRGEAQPANHRPPGIESPERTLRSPDAWKRGHRDQRLGTARGWRRRATAHTRPKFRRRHGADVIRSCRNVYGSPLSCDATPRRTAALSPRAAATDRSPRTHRPLSTPIRESSGAPRPSFRVVQHQHLVMALDAPHWALSESGRWRSVTLRPSHPSIVARLPTAHSGSDRRRPESPGPLARRGASEHRG